MDGEAAVSDTAAGVSLTSDKNRPNSSEVPCSVVPPTWSSKLRKPQPHVDECQSSFYGGSRAKS